MGSFSLSGGVEVLGFISPTDSLDTYAVIDPLYGVDGFRNVNFISDLDLIPEPRRRAGMVVGVSGGTTYYKLNSSPWNYNFTDWSVFNTGGNLSVDYLPLSGGTVTGNTIFTLGLSANTISATTYQNLPIDVRVTGGTYSNGTTTFTNNTGGTFNVTGFYTGGTDVFVTGGTYSNGTTIFTNNTGGTFSVTGFSVDATFTGGTVTGSTTFTNGLTSNTISATTYQNLPIDVRVTGGTYSNGSVTFTNNTGGTFNVTGLYTGQTSYVNSLTTGVGLSGNSTNGNITIINTDPDQVVSISGGTNVGITGTYPNFNITLTGLSDNNIYTTGFTYSANTFNISDNSGNTFSTTIDTVTGLTVNGVLSAITYQNLPQYYAGTISGSTNWIDNNDGSITLPNLNVALFSTSDFSGPLNLYDISTTTFVLNNNDTNYIGIDYNGGSPIYFLSNNDGLINDSDVILYLIIYRANNFLHVLEFGDYGSGLPNKLNDRVLMTDRFAHETGCILGLSGATGIVTLTDGIVWNGVYRQIMSAITSNDGIFFQNYHIGGNWVYTTTASTLNNKFYDNGTNLVSATTGNYLVNWYFRGQEVNDHLYEVFGNNEYPSVAAAELSLEPLLPELVTSHAFLVGRIIVGVNQTTGITQTAFVTPFVSSQVTNHNDLLGLQGGGPGEYYHLTSNEYNNLVTKNVDNNFSVGQTINGLLSATTISSPGSTSQVIYNNGGVLSADTGFVYSGGNVGIGTSTPSEKLDVSGKTKTINLQVTSGATAGYILTAVDSSGNTKWEALGSTSNELDPVLTITGATASTVNIGDRFLISGGTGIWLGKTNQIAEYTGVTPTDYSYYIPVIDDVVFVTDTLTTYRFDGTNWVAWRGTAILQNGNSLTTSVNIGTNNNQNLTLRTNGQTRVNIDTLGTTNMFGTTNLVQAQGLNFLTFSSSTLANSGQTMYIRQSATNQYIFGSTGIGLFMRVGPNNVVNFEGQRIQTTGAAILSTTRLGDPNILTLNGIPSGVTAGTQDFRGVLVNPTVNFGGTYSGNFIGYLHNPTITSMANGRHIAMQIVSGDVLLNTTSGNVGIGTTTPTAKLDVSGKTKTISLQVTSGATTGYVLTSDASGNATWQVPTVTANTYTTGFTYNNNTFTISDNSGSTYNATINSVTGLTVNGILSATTISGGTFYGDGSNLTGLNIYNLTGGTEGQILSKDSSADYDYTWKYDNEVIQLQIISEGNTISDGFKGYRYVDKDLVLHKTTILANSAATVDFRVSYSGGTIGLVGITGQTTSIDTTLSGWVTNLSGGTFLEFNVDNPGSINATQGTIILIIEGYKKI